MIEVTSQADMYIYKTVQIGKSARLTVKTKTTSSPTVPYANYITNYIFLNNRTTQLLQEVVQSKWS